MASLPDPFIPSMNNLLAARTQGYQTGAAMREREEAARKEAEQKSLLTSAGGLAASGNLRGARDALYRGGDFTRAAAFDEQLRARAREAKTDALEKAAKFQAMLGNLAMIADTPEKWAKAVDGLKQRGVDVSQYADFTARDYALAQAGKVSDVLTMEIQRRKAEAAGQGSKAATPLEKAMAARDAKAGEDYATASQGAADMAQNLGALEDARSRTNFEGSWLNNAATRAIGRNIGGFGGIIPTSKDVQALDQIEAASGSLTRQAAESLKGALSDRDLAFLQQSQPGGSMTDEAAQAPIAIIKGGGLRAQARAEMYDAWVQQYGSARGFQQAWNRYSADNAIVGRDAKGRTVYQIEPRTDWRQYLGMREGQAPGAPTPPPAPSAPDGNDPLGIL